MSSENIYRDSAALERYIERSIGRLDEKDREAARRYLGDLASNGVGLRRVHKIATILSMIAREVKRPLADLEREDVKRYCAWLERSDYSDWSRHDHRIILRGYMRWLGRAGAVDWMKIREPNNNTLPEEVLSEGEIKAIVGAAYTTRDRAFVLGLYESGCRIGEFLPLKVKHLSFDKHGAVLRVSGKTGDRRVRLVASTLPLQRWLDEHPDKDDPEAYLWCQIPGPYHPTDRAKKRHLSYGFVSRLLQELAKTAGVKKRVNPHAFRHARATFLAGGKLTEAQLREVFGWTKSSDSPSTYVHLSGRNVDGALLAVYGIKETDRERESELKTFECPRCREKNDSTRLYCGRCGLPFQEDIIKEERLEGLLVDFIKALSERMPGAEGIFKELAEKHGLAGQPGPERRVLGGAG